MSARVLVIGAAGVFGARLAQGLLDAGFEVVLAGRSADKARTQAARLAVGRDPARIHTAILDTRTLTPDQLIVTGASIVADAAGPFQGAEPTTARAAIAAGLHYVDLADGRDFVAAFPALDAAARAAGVVALTGCSSTPALSHAVLDRMTEGWRQVVDVEAAISPGARAPRGLSVTQAILSWLGRPVRVFTGGEWTTRPGWSGLYRRDMGAAGMRRVSLCETPDLDLFVARFLPRRSALFLAGLEPSLTHFGAWLLAQVVRLTKVDPVPLAPTLMRLSGLLSAFGRDRGAMRVMAYGVDAQARARRSVWRLVAEPGEGPVTPSLPARAAIIAIAQGALPPGARACAGDLSLDRLQAEIERHTLTTALHSERAAVHARALGDDFDALPDPIRALHETPGVSVWNGRARTWGAATPPARLVARLFGFPPDQDDAPVQVCIDADGDRSIWRRRIGGHDFSSVLSRPGPDGAIHERFGPLTFRLRLSRDGARLIYAIQGWALGPIPLPRFLAPATDTFETVDDHGRFVFDVAIGLPLLGRMVRYRGWLERVE